MTYPQGDDRDRYAQTQTGQTLPRYDPLISEKIKIADLATQLAADTVRGGEEEGQLVLSSCFEAWELSPPTGDDERALFTILDDLLEIELFQAEEIPTDEPCENLDVVSFEDGTTAYVQQWIDDRFRGHPVMDERRLLRLVCIARTIIRQAVKGERDLTEFQKRWGCSG